MITEEFVERIQSACFGLLRLNESERAQFDTLLDILKANGVLTQSEILDIRTAGVEAMQEEKEKLERLLAEALHAH